MRETGFLIYKLYQVVSLKELEQLKNDLYTGFTFAEFPLDVAAFPDLEECSVHHGDQGVDEEDNQDDLVQTEQEDPHKM